MNEPKKIKLTDAPSHKEVTKIPMPPLSNKLSQETIITTEKPIGHQHENNSENNSESIQ